MGRPNVGKSTLINTLMGEKIAAVTPWPQTTRKRQMAILTNEDAQIVFVDTPGIHQPLHKLGERMNEDAVSVLEDSDIILVLVDVSLVPNEEDHILTDVINNLKRPIPVILTLNKSDLVDSPVLHATKAAYQKLFPRVSEVISISATLGDNLNELLAKLNNLLPEGLPFFPDDQITDLFERDIAADLIREAALNNLRDEVPHSIAVRIDEYKERGDHGAYIEATLFVERESQKGIVIGQEGRKIKKIGTAARNEIEAMSGRKIFLRQRVKVRKNWRNDESALMLFGFNR